MRLGCNGKLLDLSRPQVMGVLNITPDSFSDGGDFFDPQRALDHALQMQEEGAAVVDIGGESTRPGAAPVSASEELQRVIPVIDALQAQLAVPISIDTRKPEVMQAAVAAGAGLINDVNALRASGALEVAAVSALPVCLMHMRGDPRTMQADPHYADVVEEVKVFLLQRVAACEAAGIGREAGAEPEIRICPWNKWIPKEKAIYEETPTVDKPLLYHLFGHMSVANSLVFSEDRFFDYLIGVTLNKSLIPSAVRAALSSTSLLFLGMQMDDWEFRVFFRFLMAQEGREMLKFFSHAAAQIEPEEDRTIDVKRARRYLEEYFEGENIEIYWGSTQEFLEALKQRL